MLVTILQTYADLEKVEMSESHRSVHASPPRQPAGRKKAKDDTSSDSKDLDDDDDDDDVDAESYVSM